MQEQEALRGRGKAMSAALKKGWEAAAGLDPLFVAVAKGDSGKTAEWRKVFGRDRRARLGLTAVRLRA